MKHAGCRHKAEDGGGAAHVSAVHRIRHDLHPALEGGHLEEGEVGPAHVVKLHLGVEPHGVVLLETRRNVRHNLGVHWQSSRDIKALKTDRWRVSLIDSRLVDKQVVS